METHAVETHAVETHAVETHAVRLYTFGDIQIYRSYAACIVFMRLVETMTHL